MDDRLNHCRDEDDQQILCEESDNKMRASVAQECGRLIFNHSILQSYGWRGSGAGYLAICFSEMVALVRQLATCSLDNIDDFIRDNKKYFNSVGKYLVVCECLSRDYRYCEAINLFMAVCDRLRKYYTGKGVNYDFFLSSAWSGFNQASKLEVFVLFARHVIELYAEEYRLRFTRERTLLRNRQRDFETNIDKIFSMHRRVIVLRLDLYYRPSELNKIDSKIACKDFERMLSNRRHNRIFEGMIGYIAKLEYGIQRGFHWHVIFFLDGDIRMPTADIYHAKKIGEYWSEFITGGAGSYFNINASTKRLEELERVGVGCISRGDENALQNLKKYVLGYLLKAEQEVREIDGPRLRMIRSGFGSCDKLEPLGGDSPQAPS